MKDFILAINNLKIDIITNSDNLDSYELGNIKKHARDLYESLVWLQYAKEEVGVMERPNRYPYTRSQWKEETVDYYTYEDGIYFTSHIFKNRLTGEIKSKEFE